MTTAFNHFEALAVILNELEEMGEDLYVTTSHNSLRVCGMSGRVRYDDEIESWVAEELY